MRSKLVVTIAASILLAGCSVVTPATPTQIPTPIPTATPNPSPTPPPVTEYDSTRLGVTADLPGKHWQICSGGPPTKPSDTAQGEIVASDTPDSHLMFAVFSATGFPGMKGNTTQQEHARASLADIFVPSFYPPTKLTDVQFL